MSSSFSRSNASPAVLAGLALLVFLAGRPARAQDAPFRGATDGFDDALPQDMDEASASTNPYRTPPGVKLGEDVVIEHWEATPRRLAQEMTARYGPPDSVAPLFLVWRHRGPWERIVVREDAAPRRFPFPHNDWLEQTLSYKVPPGKFSDLAAFDGGLLADRARGEMTARSDSERANYAALNLADEVVSGKKTPEQARRSLSDLADPKAPASPYSQGLLFARQANTADPD